MHVMIMAQHYAPEEVSGAVLATELAEDLVQRGHEVTFVTCAPNYPHGKIFPGYRNSLYHTEVLNRVRVVRTWSYISPQKSFWRRILSYGTFSSTALLGGLVAGKPEVVLSFSPPLPLGFSAFVLSRLWRVPWILNVMDIYPDVAVATGILRNRIAISLFSKMEYFLYRKASRIQVLSYGFRENLINKGVPEDKISVVPTWADPNIIRPMNKENSFRQKYSLENKFVVMYSGNFGHNSSLEDIIYAAEKLRDDQNVSFVLVGEGVKKHTLVTMAKQNKLSNILFLPFQPRESYNTMLAASDIGVVTLSPDAYFASLPSKIFNIMASGRPILVIAPKQSEIANLVEENNCGIVVSPRQPVELVKVIIMIKGDEELMNNMGKRGRQLLEQKYSRHRCINLYNEDFRRVMN